MNLLRDERRKSESWVRVKAVLPRRTLHVGSPNMLSPSGLLMMPAEANFRGGGGVGGIEGSIHWTAEGNRIDREVAWHAHGGVAAHKRSTRHAPE